jgi:thiamine biosynthesis lipoprotein
MRIENRFLWRLVSPGESAWVRIEARKSKIERKIVNTLCCFLLLAIMSSCAHEKEKIYKKSTIMMDTVITRSVVSHSKSHAEQAINSAFSEIKRLEALFDFYSPDSEVSRINKHAGLSRVTVSPDMLTVLERASFVSEKTGGAFDVTIGSLLVFYDFAHGIKPQQRAIEMHLPLVNYKAVRIDRKDASVFLEKKGMLIDLGGIVKGYVADRVVETLKRAGIRSGLVAVAGDIKAFGLKPNEKPWKIGIKDPRAEGKDDIIATLDLKDMAISTSGDYERYFILEGERYHHLLSPKTGYPARICQSVSIIAEEGALADAFATGVFILGPEKGMTVIKEMGFDGLIIDKEGIIHVTPNIREKIEFEKTFTRHNES